MKTLTAYKYHEDAAINIGGKAAQLQRLTEMGFSVPRWTVIPNQVLLDLIPESLHHSTDLKKVRDCINELTVPASVMSFIHSFFNIDPQSNISFAVRSSAIDEDGAEFSFAGQFESYLFVNKSQLESHIKKVWKSAFSDRVAAYRKEHGISHQVGIAVIIQEMVDADVAGVGFGIDPVSGDRAAKVISSVYGLGEGLVSGALDADTFLIKSREIESKIAKKELAFIKDGSGYGIKTVMIEEAKKLLPSLSESQILKVVSVLDQLKKAFLKPQDIEFAFVGNEFYLLQARPITQLNKILDTQGKRIVWDNSNIIESYPGVTTPLTFSFIIKMYEAVYTQFSLLLGIKEEEIEAHQYTFANMLGLINGRVYYNLKSWYQLLSLLPGYALNAQFMEKMMGVKEKFELEESAQLSKTRAWLRIGSTVFRLVKSLVTLPKQRREFQAFLDKVISEYHNIDFDQCRPDELMQLYLRFEKILVKEWKAPLINDLFAMIYFGTLEKLIKKWEVGTNPNLHNDLHCGSNDIISTEPITKLLALTEMISSDEFAYHFFCETPVDSIWVELERNNFPAIKNKIDEYIDQFGERCVGELKLETISYKQDPTVLISIIKSYVQQGVSASISHENIEEKLRTEAEKEVKDSLRGKWLKKRVFNYVLRMSRALVSGRENLRYERTRGFGVVRSIFSAIGKQFFAEGIIEDERDIFYLTKEEIFAFIGGTSISVNLKSLIQLRKEEFATYQEMPQPSERITTNGVVYHGNDFYKKTDFAEIEGDLKGIGCCPGKVRSRVQVILDPREVHSLDGDILVTSSTDPGWVTLFPTASAIIVERGSLLSHSAIVSRELGIPCIVGVTGLLNHLKTGDEIEMDGSSGNIKIINNHG